MYYVYRFLNKEEKIIYIGRTENLNERLTKQHFTIRGHLPQVCYEETKRVDYAEINSRSEMKIYELYLINKHQPNYNVQDNTNEVFQFKLPDLQWVEYTGEKEKSKQEEIKGIEKKVNRLRKEVKRYREKEKVLIAESDRLLKEAVNHIRVIDYILDRSGVQYEKDSVQRLLLDIGYFCDVVVEGKDLPKRDYYTINGWGTEDQDTIIWELIHRRDKVKI